MPTVAHAFNEAGYRTAYFGKWHLDGAKEGKVSVTKWIVPPERRGGFDVWIGYENNNAQWNTWVHGFDGEKEDEAVWDQAVASYVWNKHEFVDG